MKRIVLCLLLFAISKFSQAQSVTLEPCQSPSSEGLVTVVFDPTGTALAGETNVYLHAGVVTKETNSPTGSDWDFVKGTWGTDNGVGKMTLVNGKWRLELGPTSLRNYFGVPAATNINYLAMVVRNAAGSKQTSDIFIRLNQPLSIPEPAAPQLFVNQGSSVNIRTESCAAATSLKLEVNEGAGFYEIGSNNGASSLTVAFTPAAAGTKVFRSTAVISGATSVVERTVDMFVKPASPVIAALPAGVRPGINYQADPTKATLVLETPITKDFVYVAGDFNNWSANPNYFMKKTADGKYFWLEVTGLESGKEYAFQYWVDGTIKIGDPYADKIADPWQDQNIPATTYPGLLEYRRTEHGIASVLQTNQTPFAWAATESSWTRPPKTTLRIYELLVRDFVGTRNYKTLTDSIGYFKRLGINAIQLMPIMEFENNESWGYNPSYFFAPDKYYGPKNDLKNFIQECHKQGIAVILDIALNHAFGQNPWVQMYWDKALSKPMAGGPYFNPDATHPFNVGYDFNHESIHTKNIVDSVTRYWIREYHIDGYRFDLSKGFTQKNSGSNVGTWSAYDATRIALWDRISKKIWDIDPTSYVILEHFADESEEIVLGEKGMIMWRNLNYNYRNSLNGNVNESFGDARSVIHVSYSESHDEERTAFDMVTNGSSSGDYNIRDINTMLDRAKLGAAFLLPLPGAKMLWQFQELGYDKSINTCRNGSIGDCRLDNKPLPWGAGGLQYYENEERQKLFETFAAINKLVLSNPEVFESGEFTSWIPQGDIRRINITHPELKVVVVGNFATTYKEGIVNFGTAGTWYDYFSGYSITLAQPSTTMRFAPGEFHIFTSVQQPLPRPGIVTSVEEEAAQVSVYPNPVKNGRLLVNGLPANAVSVDAEWVTANGVRINQQDVDVDGGAATIDVASMPKGLYILRLKTKGFQKTQKVVIE